MRRGTRRVPLEPESQHYWFPGNDRLASISTLFLDQTAAAGQAVDQAILDAVAASPPDLLYLTPLTGHPINPKPKPCNWCA